MIAVGLDVSLDRIGWGAARDGEPLACGCVNVRPGGAITPDPLDPRRVRRMRAGIDAAFFHTEQLAEMSEEYLVFIEAPWAGTNPQTTVTHALAVGSAWQAAHDVFRVEPELLQPQEWKRLAAVPPTPREGRRTLKGVALREHAVEVADVGFGRPALGDELRRVKPEKPLVYLRARVLGFDPDGSQDAADAALIAVAGWRVAVERGALVAA